MAAFTIRSFRQVRWGSSAWVVVGGAGLGFWIVEVEEVVRPEEECE